MQSFISYAVNQSHMMVVIYQEESTIVLAGFGRDCLFRQGERVFNGQKEYTLKPGCVGSMVHSADNAACDLR